MICWNIRRCRLMRLWKCLEVKTFQISESAVWRANFTCIYLNNAEKIIMHSENQKSNYWCNFKRLAKIKEICWKMQTNYYLKSQRCEFSDVLPCNCCFCMKNVSPLSGSKAKTCSLIARRPLKSQMTLFRQQPALSVVWKAERNQSDPAAFRIPAPRLYFDTCATCNSWHPPTASTRDHGLYFSTTDDANIFCVGFKVAATALGRMESTRSEGEYLLKQSAKVGDGCNCSLHPPSATEVMLTTFPLRALVTEGQRLVVRRKARSISNLEMITRFHADGLEAATF